MKTELLQLEQLNKGAEIEGIDFRRYIVLSRVGELITLKCYSGTIVKTYSDLINENRLCNNFYGLDKPGYKHWSMIQRSAQDILAYCNFHGYSDCEPFEVVKTVSATCVEVRAMDYAQITFPKEFHIGGFSAHCADNHAQDYKYTSNVENSVVRVRWSERKKQWQDSHGRRYIMSNEPYRFYDYNF